MRTSNLFMIAFLALSICKVQAKESIGVPEHFPTQGKSTLIHLQDENANPIKGAKVSVTYRPESKVEKTVDLGITNEAGTVRWTPEDAGVAAIKAEWAKGAEKKNLSETISIKFASTPAGGILIMVSAGLLLIGSSVIRFIRLMRSPGDI